MTITLGGDLTVSRLGFGAMRITGPDVWGDPTDRGSARALLRRAVELGVNFIDTADAYGPGVSESLIAEALHPYPAGLVIATKAGLVRGGPSDWSHDGTPRHLLEACDASLRRLRLDRIDVYQLHRPDPRVPIEESIGALRKLQDVGKVRHIGLSNVSVEELHRAQKVARIVSVQNRYSLFYRAAESVLQVCAAEGLAFIPWFPLAAGELHQHPTLSQVANARGLEPAQVALAWLLQRSPAMLPIPGTSSMAHLEMNIAAANVTLSSDELRKLTEQ
jgi:aryl-alcohol dehydrogenase-like predicted oxidoreductase